MCCVETSMPGALAVTGQHVPVAAQRVSGLRGRVDMRAVRRGVGRSGVGCRCVKPLPVRNTEPDVQDDPAVHGCADDSTMYADKRARISACVIFMKLYHKELYGDVAHLPAMFAPSKSLRAACLSYSILTMPTSFSALFVCTDGGSVPVAVVRILVGMLHAGMGSKSFMGRVCRPLLEKRHAGEKRDSL